QEGPHTAFFAVAKGGGAKSLAGSPRKAAILETSLTFARYPSTINEAAMTLSTRIVTLAAAAFLALGGAVSSAPSPAADSAYRPGMDGVDLAAVTGPKGSGAGRVAACADPARRGDLRPC